MPQLNKNHIYHSLPDQLKPPIRKLYTSITGWNADATSWADQRIITNPKEVQRDHEIFIMEYFESEEEYQGYIEEWKSSPQNQYLKEARKTTESWDSYTGARNLYYLPVYAYLRKTKPDHVVYTGVDTGWSIFYFLSALQKNDRGTLYALAESEEIQSNNNEFERTIPDELLAYNDWELRVGTTPLELTKLVQKHNSIDVFIHDSSNIFSSMMYEFELAYHWLNNAGILFADNIYVNRAFDIFLESRECQGGKLAGGSALDDYFWKLGGPPSSLDQRGHLPDLLGYYKPIRK